MARLGRRSNPISRCGPENERNYRQEALTNVSRHAQVSEATVRVWAMPDVLGLEVEDRGVGFEADSILMAPYSTGVSAMRERAFLMNGQFTLESAPGLGTQILVELPLGPHTHERET